jgi:hypothetical protein
MPYVDQKLRLPAKQRAAWIRARLKDNQIVFSRKWPPVKKAMYKLWQRARERQSEY